jgi:hypothetical protein
MSQTDPCAVAIKLVEQFGYHSDREMSLADIQWLVAHIGKALADAERRGMERAVAVAEDRSRRARGPEELRSVYLLRKKEAEWMLSAILGQRRGEAGRMQSTGDQP